MGRGRSTRLRPGAPACLAGLAVGETVILLHPPLPLVGVSIVAPAAVGETVILLHPPLHLVQVFQ